MIPENDSLPTTWDAWLTNERGDQMTFPQTATMVAWVDPDIQSGIGDGSGFRLIAGMEDWTPYGFVITDERGLYGTGVLPATTWAEVTWVEPSTEPEA